MRKNMLNFGLYMTMGCSSTTTEIKLYIDDGLGHNFSNKV